MTRDQAFLNNLDLSQARSSSVLGTCISLEGDGAVRDWAISKLAAIGYSSSRPIEVDGMEDAMRSRRVVLAVELDRAGLLNDINREVGRELVAQ